MNVFMEHLSAAYPDDLLLLVMDKASWHRSKGLSIPENIRILHIPPYTPEMNPIEQIWKELRKIGFRNELFKTLDKVVERLCATINSLTNDMIKSITGRDWIVSMF
jgi:putative transposase